MVPYVTRNSIRRPCNQVVSLTPLVVATYLASVVDKVAIDSKDAFQEIAPV